MPRQIIATPKAPKAIGPYSQAVRTGNTVFLSGQIPLDPTTGELVAGDIEAQTRRVLDNLQAVIEAAGGNFSAVVKVNIYLIDLKNFAVVNQLMTQYFREPYPARATVQVSALPRGAQVEIDCVLDLS